MLTPKKKNKQTKNKQFFMNNNENAFNGASRMELEPRSEEKEGTFEC